MLLITEHLHSRDRFKYLKVHMLIASHLVDQHFVPLRDYLEASATHADRGLMAAVTLKA